MKEKIEMNTLQKRELSEELQEKWKFIEQSSRIEQITTHLFDLACDIRMLRQLLREQEVGFPTPEDEAVNWESIVWTMREHLTYLALTINSDPRCPAPCSTGPFYPLGEGRMSDEEFKQ